MEEKNALTAMSAAILANGEAKARVRRKNVQATEQPKEEVQADPRSVADHIRRAKTTEEVDSILKAGIRNSTFASAKTRRRWERIAATRKKQIQE